MSARDRKPPGKHASDLRDFSPENRDLLVAKGIVPAFVTTICKLRRFEIFRRLAYAES
jgi:hypothetical protein